MRAIAAAFAALTACTADPSVFHDPDAPGNRDATDAADAAEMEHVGFTGPFDGAPYTVAAGTLDAFRGGPMPRCWVVEQIAIVVTAATPSSRIQLGLYEHDATKPKERVWDSGALVLGGDPGLRMIDIADVVVHTDKPQSSWIAVMTTADVTLATQATSGMYCTKPHSLGTTMPMKFDDGPDPMCSTAAPPAIWLIGRRATGC